MARRFTDLGARLGAAADVVRRGAVVDAVFFDSAAYRAENEDVAASVDARKVRSFYDHYVRYGKWEGRRFALRRFAVGRYAVDEQRVIRIFRAAAALETRVDALACALVPGELAHRLASAEGRLQKPLGPWKRKLDRGPWRAPLPAFAEGFVTVHARVAPVRAPLAFRVLDVQGEPLEVGATFCKPGRSVQRMLRVPPGAETLEVELLDRRLRAQPLRVRLRPVPDARVERRMLRRLIHHAPDCLGQTEHQLRDRFDREAKRAGRTPRELMWIAYDGTFPRPLPHANYADWIERVETPARERLNDEAPARIAALPVRPRLSILLPVYDPPEDALARCIASVTAQSYPDWELCIVDDASPSPSVRRLLEAQRDPRIRLHFRSENGHISAASQDALEAATGAFTLLLDHDDELAPHALLHVAEALAAHPGAEVLYSDEDKIDERGERCEPHFKPAFDPDLLLGQNYFGHLLIARTERMRAVGGFRRGYEGSQDHDLALRLTEGLPPDQVVDIPHVLYHWRMSAASTAGSSVAKPYTADAGIRAVRDALARRGEQAEVTHAAVPHCYRVERALPAAPPKVSVIVPTRDAARLLATCADSLLAHTDYPDYEVLVVDNGSVEPAALAYLARIEAEHSRVRVLRDPRPFNFSALNNRAAAEARGEVLILLNNDIEVVDPSWMRALVANAVRPDVGCVGARLLYPDGTLQHAGVVTGLHGLAGHPYRLMSGSFVGYYGRLTVPHAVSAVTAACLAVRRELYRQVGGLDEALAVAFNDVDFCLRVQRAGHRNLLVPQAVLVHHESATRGLDQSGEKRRRFQGEVARMKERWGAQLYADPRYSPHLSLDHDDYSIRIPG